jgi:hypothetical protein
MSEGPVKPPITATSINAEFDQGFSLSNYRGFTVRDLARNLDVNLPGPPAPISYSDFLNKTRISYNYPVPDIIFIRQPQDKTLPAGPWSTDFYVEVDVDWRDNTWPSQIPSATDYIVSYKWQVSVNSGDTWIDVGNNIDSLQLTDSMLPSDVCTEPATISDDLAEYSVNNTTIWTNGFTSPNTSILVVNTAPGNTIAETINNWYLNDLNRPAEQAGLNFWYNTWIASGESVARANFLAASQIELARGSVTIYSFCEWQALNRLVQVRVLVTASILAPLRQGESSVQVVSVTESSRVATISRTQSPPVFDLPVVIFDKTFLSRTLTVTVNELGQLLAPASGNMTFDVTDLNQKGYRVLWPTIPADRAGTRVVTFSWEWTEGLVVSPAISQSGTLQNNPLDKVSNVEDRYITFTNLGDTAYDGYSFRLKVTATQNLINPPAQLVGQGSSNSADLVVLTQTETTLATLVSLTVSPANTFNPVPPNVTVIDRLSAPQVGPLWRLTTSNAVGKTLRIQTTNNSEQMVPENAPGPIPVTALRQAFDLTVFGDVMDIGLAFGGSSGLLSQDARWMPETETITVTALEANGWNPRVINQNFRILNDQFKGTLTPDTNIVVLEGEPVTGTVVATDLPNGSVVQWSWVVGGGFSIGNDPLVNDFTLTDDRFGFVFQGDNRNGRYVGSFSIPTIKNPINPSTGSVRVVKSQGTLTIRDVNGTIFAIRSVTIEKWASCIEPANISDSLAEYSVDNTIVWSNGLTAPVDSITSILVVNTAPDNTIAATINNWYLADLGRPADQTGLNFWYNSWIANGEAATRTTFLQLAEFELVRGEIAGIYSFCEYRALTGADTPPANPPTVSDRTFTSGGTSSTILTLFPNGQTTYSSSGNTPTLSETTWTTDLPGEPADWRIDFSDITQTVSGSPLTVNVGTGTSAGRFVSTSIVSSGGTVNGIPVVSVTTTVTVNARVTVSYIADTSISSTFNTTQTITIQPPLVLPPPPPPTQPPTDDTGDIGDSGGSTGGGGSSGGGGGQINPV